MKLLHVYGQDHEHDDVWISGERESLTALRDLLTHVIDSSEPGSCELMTADGEGFVAIVVPTTQSDMEAREVGLPYTSFRFKGKHPIVLVGPEKYRQLVREPRAARRQNDR